MLGIQLILMVIIKSKKVIERQTLSKSLLMNIVNFFENIKDKQFHIIAKIIDACNDLSVQVHPNDEYAGLHENSLERQNAGMS